MTKPLVLIYAPREEPREIHRQLEDAGYALAFGDRAWQLPRGDHEAAFVAAAREAVALLGTSIRATPISRRVLEASQRLRIVSKYTVGVDDVDLEAATDLGILVCHAPTEHNCFGVAESTVALMLTMLKKIRERETDIYGGKWREADRVAAYVGSRASDGYPGITLGLLGLGRIGSRVADLMKPWGCRIIACDPYVEPMKFLLHGAERVDYATLLRESDVVSVHVVLTRETRYMMSDAQFALMKPSAILVNTARGRVVDEAALARALESGRIAGAAVDAWEDEPVAPDSPLRRLGHRMLLSPHAAALTDGGELRAGIAMATRAVIEALSGRVPDNVYNKEVLPRWRERFAGASVTG
jgi:phosphoglycerate dehydrogenase-like enzyme